MPDMRHRLTPHQQELLRTTNQREIARTIRDTMRTISEQGYAKCRLCAFHAYGDSFDEILVKLGEHGSTAHPEAFTTS